MDVTNPVGPASGSWGQIRLLCAFGGPPGPSEGLQGYLYGPEWSKLAPNTPKPQNPMRSWLYNFNRIISNYGPRLLRRIQVGCRCRRRRNRKGSSRSDKKRERRLSQVRTFSAIPEDSSNQFLEEVGQRIKSMRRWKLCNNRCFSWRVQDGCLEATETD